MNLEEKSKYLSYVLRHKPETIGIKLDKEGWTDVEKLIEASKKTQLTREELEEIVATDEKRRYSFTEDGTKIRANQGHSSAMVRMSFKKAIPPVVLYHGTSYDNLFRVLREGLKPMNRHHVHLSSDLSTAQDVAGRRKGETTIFEIDAKQMLADKVQFFVSENDVWLVDFVDPKYLKPLDNPADQPVKVKRIK